MRHAGGDGDVVERADIVDREDRSRERVFGRPGSIDRIAKQARSTIARAIRIKLRPAPDVLVFDNGAVGRGARVQTRCELNVPVYLIAAQEGEIDTRTGRGLYVGELRLRPIFVVTDIDVGLGIEQQRRIGCGIDARDVADVVAVLLQPVDRCKFLAKQEILWPAQVGRRIHSDRTIVADRVRAIAVRSAGALIQIVSAPSIVCFPSLVAGLEQHVRRCAIIADDERNHVLEIARIRRQLGEVDPRHGGAGDRPGIRDRPVPGIDGVGRVSEDRSRLIGRSTVMHGRDEMRAVAAVIAKAIDVEGVAARGGVDLEGDGLPCIGAHLRGKALDLRVSLVVHRAVDCPHALGRARLLIFRNDFIGRVAERRSRGLAVGSGRELQHGTGGAAIGGDLPLSDDGAVDEAVGIAGPSIRHIERRIDIGNAVDAGVTGQVCDLEGDRASGVDAGHGEGGRAARCVVRLVGRDGHRFRCRHGRARPGGGQ